MPAIVPIHATDADAVAEVCRKLETEMAGWLSRKEGAAVPTEKTITFAYLFRQFRERDSSPFNRVEWNTRRTYSQVLDSLEEVIGSVRLSDVKIDHFWRWYNEARWPEGKGRGKRETIHKAHGYMNMLRRTLSFGIGCELPECARLKGILDEQRFPAPKPREIAPHLGHVLAFIKQAKAMGRMSLALGTAIQYETGMRQRDVIGEWKPIDGTPISPFILFRREWLNGLMWAQIGADGVFYKKTTKTGAVVSHDMTYYPLTTALIQEIPLERRSWGPMIIDEKTNRPYAENAFQREWRKVARLAGVPDEIRNTDMRAGAATEADEAGAEPTDIQRMLGHTDVKTTMRYIRSKGLARTRRVAQARIQLREEKEHN